MGSDDAPRFFNSRYNEVCMYIRARLIHPLPPLNGWRPVYTITGPLPLSNITKITQIRFCQIDSCQHGNDDDNDNVTQGYRGRGKGEEGRRTGEGRRKEEGEQEKEKGGGDCEVVRLPTLHS